MSFIFLSHSSHDNAAASAVCAWLQGEGHAAVFLDHDAEDGIAGGEPWEERLYTELRRCRALIALVGPDWLASPWCVAEADHAQALRKPVLPLKIKPIDPVQYADKAPPVLRRVQSIDWNQDEEACERLRRGLLTAGLDPRDSFVLHDDRPPYPGLAAFKREDAAVYFGREQEITDLLALLRECRAPGRPRLVLVQGASGTGKSSLLRAGILPRLERDPENWLVVPPLRPLRDPLQGLTDALVAAGAELKEPPPLGTIPDSADQAARVGWIAAWAEWLSSAAAGLRRQASRPEATVLLSVDQLEEALAGMGGGISDLFLLALREVLTAADHRLLVVATLRADFTGTLQRHPVLREPATISREILATRAFQLGPLPRAAFHAVIESPATLFGLELEPGLTSRIVDEARTDDALPLLAFGLRELWDHYGKNDLQLTHAEYDNFGGLEAAVGRRAQQIIAAVDPSTEELEAFRAALVFRMAELSAEGRILRQRLPWAEVPERARRLIEDFVQARLLVVDEDAVEVAHEALFRHWEPLKGWIDGAKEDLGLRRRAREAAEAWDHAGRPRGSLWRRPDLDLLQRYAGRNPGTLDRVQAAFLHASEQQERLSWWVRRGVVILIALLAVGAGAFGLESQRQAQRAEEQARESEAARDGVRRFTSGFAASLRDVEGIRVETIDEALKTVSKLVSGLRQRSQGGADLDWVEAKMHHEFAKTLRESNLDRALPEARKGLALLDHIGAQRSQNPEWMWDRALSLELIGDIQLDTARTLQRTRDPTANTVFDKARAAYNEVHAIRRRLRDREPGNRTYAHGIALIRTRMADLYVNPDRAYEKALDAYREAAQEAELVFRSEPDMVEWQSGLSWSYWKLGEFADLRGNYAEALLYAQRSLCIRRFVSLWNDRNALYKRDVAFSMEQVSDVMRKSDDFVGASRMIFGSLMFRRQLSEGDPRNHLRRREMGQTLLKVSELYLSDEPALAAGFALVAGDVGNENANFGDRTQQTTGLIENASSQQSAAIARLQAAPNALVPAYEALREGAKAKEAEFTRVIVSNQDNSMTCWSDLMKELGVPQRAVRAAPRD